MLMQHIFKKGQFDINLMGPLMPRLWPGTQVAAGGSVLCGCVAVDLRVRSKICADWFHRQHLDFSAGCPVQVGPVPSVPSHDDLSFPHDNCAAQH